MEVLEEYVEDNQLRMVDLFFEMDKDRSGTVTREEVEHAIDALDLDLNEEQTEELMDRMDLDGDGE